MEVYMKDGEVIGESDVAVADWIARNELEVVAGWGMNIRLPFKTVDMTLEDALVLLTPEQRRKELTEWLTDILLKEPGTLEDIQEMLDIVPIEVVPMAEREYRIEPCFEPWQVKGREIDDYYDEAESMDVGETYQNSAYRITRNKNARPAKGGRRGRRFRCSADAISAWRSSPRKPSS